MVYPDGATRMKQLKETKMFEKMQTRNVHIRVQKGHPRAQGPKGHLLNLVDFWRR